VTGKPDPDTENPLPVTDAEFTVTAAVPLDVSVIVCTAWDFTVTAPNEMFVALYARVGVCVPPEVVPPEEPPEVVPPELVPPDVPPEVCPDDEGVNWIP
jgi:hypothetical protein